VVIDGQCNFGYTYISDLAKSLYGLWYFFSYFCVIISIFVYCYGRIIAVVRRQTLAFTAQHINNQPAKAVELRALRTQTNTIMTTITISVLFVVCWLPADTYSLIAFTTNVNLAFVAEIYYVTVFVAFFNVCLNPFIYAAKYELVRRYWLKLVPWRSNSISPSQVEVPLTANVTNVRTAVTSRATDDVS
jgi:7 transmembrane receptor (rhodopsin family)